MHPMHRSQFTLGQLMMAIALLAIQAALVSATMHSTGAGRLLALIAAVWFLPFSLMVILSLRLERESGHGWSVRLFAKHCPRCARRFLVVETPPSLYECAACGARFQRLRNGFLKLVDAPEDRGVWVGPYLKYLRELRGRMRPSAGLDPLPPARLDLRPLPGSKDVPDLADPALGSDEERSPQSSLPPRGVPVPRREKPPRPSIAFSTRTMLLAGVTAACLAALMIEGRRLIAKDDQHLFFVLTIIFYALYFCLMVGFMARFRTSQILFMLAVSAGLQAVFLGAAGHDLGWITILESSVFIPTTPLLLGVLIARFERLEAAPEDSTCSVLLRKVAWVRRRPLAAHKEGRSR
jgi:hypothetical protein